MREYGRLIDFLLDLGTAVQDYLPEEQRVNPLTLKDVVRDWTWRKSLLDLYIFRSDIKSYLKKHMAGDYSVDQLFYDYDIGFVQERFGCDDAQLLAETLQLLNTGINDRKRHLISSYTRWFRFK
jgi:hypothetical protein